MTPAWKSFLVSLVLLAGAAGRTAGLDVSPRAFLLDSPESSQQLLVSGQAAGGRAVDLTRAARYTVEDPRVAAVDDLGRVEPRGEGRTGIVVDEGRESARVEVEVRGQERPAPVSFPDGIVPLLTKARCNSGGCHGKAEGKNGFKLTVFGFDPLQDYESIVEESRGRRLFPAAPEHSLLLLKATAALPHGGGLRIEKRSLPYRRLHRWIAQGATFASGAARPAAIAVEPAERVLLFGESQQIQVTAIGDDGRRRCVTAEAEFETGAGPVAQVDSRGLVQAGGVPGEAAVLVRYLDQVAVARVVVPRPEVRFTRPPEANFIDRLVWDKLERLGIAPGEPACDAAFLRRVFLDTIGTLPSAAEARAFLRSTDPRKRERLVEVLLARDEYADTWALHWADLLRVDSDKVGAPAAVAMTRWLRRQFAENRRWDELVREIVTAVGDVRAERPASLYKVLDSPEAMARSISQLFLGVRIECAQCHHHPSEKWGQEDYYGLAGFFTGVKRKPLPSGSEAVVSTGGSELKHPRTGRPVPARALGAPPADLTGHADRRAALAAWMTAPGNPFFARAIANRLWAHYFGRGLVEPVDDLRTTNPAQNEPLLEALARHLVDLGYDLQAFTRTLLASRAYQLSSAVNDWNAQDERNFSHAAWKPLAAEVLLDAIGQATGVPEKFPGLPAGFRAIQVWDNRLPHYFFRIFGRPVRASVCECERSGEPSISQALHLMNSPEVLDKVQSPEGRARLLADSSRSPREVIDELYLSTLSRFPGEREEELLLGAFAGQDRRSAAEDVLWALLNSKEFLYNH